MCDISAVEDKEDKHLTYYMQTDGNDRKVVSPLKASINTPEYLQQSTGFSDLMTSVKGSVVILADQNGYQKSSELKDMFKSIQEGE